VKTGRCLSRLLLSWCGVVSCLAGFPAYGSVEPPPTSPPDVHFVLLRLDPTTLDVLHAYAYSQPYRKILRPEGTWVLGDLFIDVEDWGDFGSIELKSRLTGQPALRSSLDYQLPPVLEWPTPAEEVPFARGATAPDTDQFSWQPVSTRLTSAQAHLAWDSVRDLDLVGMIASQGSYGVLVIQFAWSIPPETTDILLYTRPVAPPDAAVLRLDWPRSLVTEWVRTTPVVTVHNFGDTPDSFDVEARILSDGVVVHESTRGVTDLPADASTSLSFDPFLPQGPGPLTLEARLVGPGGGSWSDTFADDDTLAGTTGLTALPVFRPIGSLRRPGSVPAGGQMIDFDGDGDLDVIKLYSEPYFIQNDGTGHFTGILHGINAGFHGSAPRDAIGADFTGDGLKDVLLSYYNRYPILLRGDGTGGFEEITQSAGLTPYTSTISLQAFDLEGDGDQDVILRLAGSPAATVVMVNDGYGHFVDGTAGTGLADATAGSEWITVGDIDGDTLPDLVMANWIPSVVYRNQGGGTYARMEILGSDMHTRMAALLDHDGDGLQDILLARNYPNQPQLFRQGPGFTFTDVTAQTPGLRDSFWAEAADLDGDGRQDLLLDLSILINRGGAFEYHPELLLDLGENFSPGVSSGRWLSGHFFDIDGDGDLDIYSLNVVYENQGLPAPPVPARVDLRPGQARDSVSARSRGLITVALFGSADLDAGDVDPSTLSFGPGGAGLDHASSLRLIDLDRDGIEDLLLQFRVDDAGLASAPGEACLEGATHGGVRFRGCGSLTLMGPD